MAVWQTCMWQTDGEVRLDLDWSNCSSGPAGGWAFGKVKCVGPTLTNIERTEDQIRRSTAVVPIGSLGALVAWRVGGALRGVGAMQDGHGHSLPPAHPAVLCCSCTTTSAVEEEEEEEWELPRELYPPRCVSRHWLVVLAESGGSYAVKDGG